MPKTLVVDDDPAVREMVRRMLQKGGWEVAEAENGRLALDMLEETAPCLILLDLMMPEMDGFEFIDDLHGPDLRGPADRPHRQGPPQGIPAIEPLA